MRWYGWVMTAGVVAAAGLGTTTGCDDNDGGVPPEVALAQQREQEQQRQRAALPATRPAPTTQELLAEPRRALRLGGFPLVVDAPKSWSVGTLGGAGEIIVLSGPATSAEITVQLIDPTQVVSAEAIGARLEAAKREADAKPFPVNRVGLRDLGPGKLLEHRVLSGNFVDGKPPEEVWGEVDMGVPDPRTGKNLTTHDVVNPRMLKWTYTFFQPAGGKDKDKYTVRTLNFMSLRLAEYERDKEFLEQMMGSLRYEAGGGGQ